MTTRTSASHENVVALERELLTTTCRSSRERVEALLHPEFREHGASGRIWTRQDVLDELPAAPAVDGVGVGFDSRDLAPGVLLLTYRIEGGRPSTRSSIWVHADGRWQMLFHQGTLIPVP